MIDPVFERIRLEVARDCRPVEPLHPAWLCSCVILPLTLGLVAVVLLAFGLRADADALSLWTLWGPTALMVGVAYAVLYLALVQRSPERALSVKNVLPVVLAVAVAQVGSAYGASLATAGTSAPHTWNGEILCFTRITLLSLPVLALVLWLSTRGLPLRPGLVGLLAAFAAGLTAEGVYRLRCGLSTPAHIVPWHTGAILLVGLIGLAVGLHLERRRASRWAEHRSR